MGPAQDLPYTADFVSTSQYVDSLLEFFTQNELLRKLCGGVHILDFFTSDPDLYASILPEDWRVFIQAHPIADILDILMRENIEVFGDHNQTWRDGPELPKSMLDYIANVRRHLLLRSPYPARDGSVRLAQKLAWHVAVGMNVKKVHEVGLFASYVDRLNTSIASSTKHNISHLMDFGSGQNYLGRALASRPYSRNIVAIETKGHNQDRAKQFDEMAKLRSKEKYMYDRKAREAGQTPHAKTRVKVEPAADGVGTVQYVEHHIKDGNLEHVVQQISHSTAEDQTSEVQALVISLHSCGNLVHHGLRSLVLNPSVKAVAMVGCCYNLVTERLNPATYKLPGLESTINASDVQESYDPHGFPMSARLCHHAEHGVRLNITARMMAVQAPQNWSEQDSNGFFTRHYYRALLQRIFLDKGVIGPPSERYANGSPLGHSSGTPIIIGSLRKSCYLNFNSYVRGALAKLVKDPKKGVVFQSKLQDLSDLDIQEYDARYSHRKKELSAIWSLMAFSAGVVEALIVVDRYLWLKEQKEVERAWVEPVFDYAQSPRNLVVVGIKG